MSMGEGRDNIFQLDERGCAAHQTHAGEFGYPQTVRDVAREEKCALIDLHAMSRTFYRALRENVDKAFQDGTHHNNFGSDELAKRVVEGI